MTNNNNTRPATIVYLWSAANGGFLDNYTCFTRAEELDWTEHYAADIVSDPDLDDAIILSAPCTLLY